MKLYIRRLNPFEYHSEDDENDALELTDLCELTFSSSMEENEILPRVEAILNFKESNISEVKAKLDHLEFELPEPEFSMALALLHIIFEEEDEKDVPDGDKENNEGYSLSWDTLMEASKTNNGIQIFEIENVEDIEPSLAINFFWKTRGSQRRDN